MICEADAFLGYPLSPSRHHPLDTSREIMSQDIADGVQNLMKGYIARERGIVVLSKGGAFPGTGA